MERDKKKYWRAFKIKTPNYIKVISLFKGFLGAEAMSCQLTLLVVALAFFIFPPNYNKRRSEKMDIKILKRYIRNMESMEKFNQQLRVTFAKMLDNGVQKTKFRANREIGPWEKQRIVFFMRIFPMVNITYNKKTITMEIKQA